MKALLPVFISIFMAELGDKTQLATLLFATEKNLSRWQVFLAAAAALTLSSLLAVLVGEQISRFVSTKTLKMAAGIGFLIIGAWTFFKA